MPHPRAAHHPAQLLQASPNRLRPPRPNRLQSLTPALVCFAALSLFVACSSSDDPSSGPENASAGSSTNPTGGTGSTSTSGGSSTSGQTSTGGSEAASGGSGASGAHSAGTSAVGGTSAMGGASSHGGDAGAPETGDYWRPKAGATWQWQLSESVGTPLDVDVYDIDWESDQASVDKLHALGIKVICYVSVGSWEDFRPDAGDFPQTVIGNDYDGWPGEKYVDIRSDALRAIMSARFDVCQAKGFDAIEPDNQDVYDLGDESGFPLTKQDGIAYAKWLAAEAHSRGMGIGQKNAPNITEDIVADYDWALTESCYSDGDWCGDVEPYTDSNKPVFMCEYAADSFNAACSAWKSKSYSPILKSLDLDEPVTFCP